MPLILDDVDKEGYPRSREAGKAYLGYSGGEEKKFLARPRPVVPEA
jgi:hypothetical protein